MQHAGFETIGGYFKVVLDHGHPKVYNSVSAFLQCRGTDPNTHPISIFQRIFKDPRSKKRAGADDELHDVHLGPPRYALPPSQRLLYPVVSFSSSFRQIQTNPVTASE
ncbi:hypothetical protein B0H14DRAFT_2934740, partial [Mycena olivaceomarginata]